MCDKPMVFRQNVHIPACCNRLASAIVLAVFLLLPSLAPAAEVVIFGDTHLKPVADVAIIIQKNLRASVAVYTPSEVNGNLHRWVAREGAKTVIALGRDAIDEALLLPSSVGVIYDMVILPVKASRPNTTGTYMATPTSEYRSLVRRFLPSLQHLTVLGSPVMHKTLGFTEEETISFQEASTSFDMISRIQQLGNTDALLLLPDPTLLSESVLEKVFLYSFRKKVPVLGVSEKNVKQGALFALVFDPAAVGKHLAKLASESLKGADLSSIPPSPPRRFLLYVNKETARKMGITIPEEMLRQAKGVFPHE